jgi:hypothetical protein
MDFQNKNSISMLIGKVETKHYQKILLKKLTAPYANA